MLTQEQLKELLHYDSNTGLFTWRVGRRGMWADLRAGTLSPSGYVSIIIKSKNYSAHRLAFLYMTGNFPINGVDHINRKNLITNGVI